MNHQLSSLDSAVEYIREDNRKQRNSLRYQVALFLLMGTSKAVDLHSGHPSGDLHLTVFMLIFSIAALPIVVFQLFKLAHTDYSQPQALISKVKKRHSTSHILRSLTYFTVYLICLLAVASYAFNISFFDVSFGNIFLLAGIATGLILGCVLCLHRRNKILKVISNAE